MIDFMLMYKKDITEWTTPVKSIEVKSDFEGYLLDTRIECDRVILKRKKKLNFSNVFP